MPVPMIEPFQELLVGPKELETTQTLQYTAPGKRMITDIYLTQDGNARTVDLWIVPPDASPANGHKLLNSFATIQNDMRPVPQLKLPLGKGWKIYAASSSTGTNLIIAGTLNT